MIDFCALDFETATNARNSACEMGICIVENGMIIETKTWLIKPPSFPFFSPFNIKIHGIEPKDVANAPTFDEVWNEAKDIFYGNILVAHNAHFDTEVLKSCLDYYGFFTPKVKYLCSMQLARKSWKDLPSYGLKNLAKLCQISFNHHRASDDAEVCAKITLIGLERLMITRTDEMLELLKNQIKIL